MIFLSRTVLPAILSLPCLIAGCGSDLKTFERIPVEGTVQFNGEPLSYGEIMLAGPRDESGESAKCVVEIREGQFTALEAGGPTPGENRVSVVLYEGEPPPPATEEDADPPEPKIIGYWEGTVNVAEDQPVAVEIPFAEVRDGNDRPLRQAKR